MTVVPRISRTAQRFPTVEAVTVEWSENRRAGEGPQVESGTFSHVMQAVGGACEPILPCSPPGCQGGGFEILEVVESMVSDRCEEKAGLLVCIGWEHMKGSRIEQSPCTRVISYRVRLTYRKRGGVQPHSKGYDREE